MSASFVSPICYDWMAVIARCFLVLAFIQRPLSCHEGRMGAVDMRPLRHSKLAALWVAGKAMSSLWYQKELQGCCTPVLRHRSGQQQQQPHRLSQQCQCEASGSCEPLAGRGEDTPCQLGVGARQWSRQSEDHIRRDHLVGNGDGEHPRQRRVCGDQSKPDGQDCGKRRRPSGAQGPSASRSTNASSW